MGPGTLTPSVEPESAWTQQKRERDDLVCRHCSPHSGMWQMVGLNNLACFLHHPVF